MSPVRFPARVEYKPVPVRTILRSMKDFSSLMLDLAYYSVIYSDKKLAKEVLRLEEFIDTLRSMLVMQAALAVRDAEDAEYMVSVFRLATSTDKISDAAADIAMIPILGIRIHPSLTAALITSDEVVSRIKVREGSNAHGKSLGKIFDENDIFVDVLALRREASWYFRPTSDVDVKVGDVLIVRGSKEAVDKLRIIAMDQVPVEEIIQPHIVHPEIAKGIAEMKNMVDLMVDLSYHAIVFNDPDVAKEVIELEDLVDSRRTILERCVIQELVGKVTSDEVISTLRVVTSLESIADAAAELAGVLISGLKPHPILKTVVDESEERIMMFKVSKAQSGMTIKSLKIEERGAIVLAIKRGAEWIFNPTDDQVLLEGDLLITKVFSEAIDVLRRMFSSGRREKHHSQT